jgi:hypothetical protein
VEKARRNFFTARKFAKAHKFKNYENVFCRKFIKKESKQEKSVCPRSSYNTAFTHAPVFGKLNVAVSRRKFIFGREYAVRFYAHAQMRETLGEIAEE